MTLRPLRGDHCTTSAMENAAEGEIVAFADLPGLALDLEGFLNLVEKLSRNDGGKFALMRFALPDHDAHIQAVV